MSRLQPIVALFEHLWWADAEVLEGLARLEAAGAEATRLSGPIELLAHVLGCELVWLDRLERRPQSVAVWPQSELDGCRDLARTSRRRFEGFLGQLAERDLERAIAYTNSAGARFTSTVEQILLHVALHGAYHRGQVALRLRAAGLEPSPTDFIAFARGAPAATRADAEASAGGARSES